MNTFMCFETRGHLTWATAVSGNARVAGEKSARDRHASKRGGELVQVIQVQAVYAPTVVPTQHVAPSAQERST
ncbi:hypothetical protein FHS29_003973 [Saccharothrix tamanrassetensis]|uniref:Uncharacterized protein n=1 Tax=Saccharothrix tamanrassetensis TaxID=1051531 RepID=A0A841CMK9_9PSEU|nr:hypothetical protein [Saccharothrix tamanrassetensis]MBB5957378.1 hypothetical protein [Saccharothrix tamanrassetensis]